MTVFGCPRWFSGVIAEENDAGLDAFSRQCFGAKWPDDTDLCGELLSCWLGKITGNVSAFEVSNFWEELGLLNFAKPF